MATSGRIGIVILSANKSQAALKANGKVVSFVAHLTVGNNKNSESGTQDGQFCIMPCMKLIQLSLGVLSVHREAGLRLVRLSLAGYRILRRLEVSGRPGVSRSVKPTLYRPSGWGSDFSAHWNISLL